MSTIGNNIRELRKKKGVPQKGLARAAGVSEYTISRIESGQTQRPQDETLEGIAKALGVDRERLLRGVELNSRRATGKREVGYPSVIQLRNGRLIIEETEEEFRVRIKK